MQGWFNDRPVQFSLSKNGQQNKSECLTSLCDEPLIDNWEDWDKDYSIKIFKTDIESEINFEEVYEITSLKSNKPENQPIDALG